MTVCALIPVKKFQDAKTRLRTVLRADQTSFVARQMAIETIHAVTQSPSVDRVVLLGNSETVTEIAAEFWCETASEDPREDLSTNLLATGKSLGLAAQDTLAVIPADVPLITREDVEDLLHRHEYGLTLCPAARDGGTNALLISPPGAIDFHFGRDSARLHAEAARAAGLPLRLIDSPAFSRDIDTADDIEWLCRHLRNGRLYEALRLSGITRRVLDSRKVLYA